MSHITDAHVTPFTVGVALDGAGWHPAAWREPDAHPSELFTAAAWRERILAAEAAGIDYVTIDDSLQLPSHGAFSDEAPPRPRADRVDARLDALLVASWVAPLTQRIGLIPTVTTTHTEPFHVATALQTLDHISGGRAGWQLRFSPSPAEAAAIGRRSAPEIDLAAVIAGHPDAGLDALIRDAADVAEVARRLWDSWEDDAVIRDVETGRFLDRDRLHHIDFAGDDFSVIGPSIVPRSPQGQLPVILLAHSPRIFELAARSADVVIITPENDHAAAGTSRGKSVARLVAEVRAAEAAEQRAALGLPPLRIVADLVVAIDGTDESATDRAARLDALAGAPFASDAPLSAGSAKEIAARIAAWRAAGIDGVRLRPLAIPHDLTGITDRLLPELRQRILSIADTSFETRNAGATAVSAPQLRERFALPAAENRYTTARKEFVA